MMLASEAHEYVRPWTTVSYHSLGFIEPNRRHHLQQNRYLYLHLSFFEFDDISEDGLKICLA
jgi:hypothetical protein